MRKNLFMTMLAGAAILSSCNQDAVNDEFAGLKGEMTDVSMCVNMNSVKSYATDVNLGAWSNFKDASTGLSDLLDVRATLHIYAENQESPLVSLTQVYDVPQMKDNEPTDVLDLPNFRLPAGQKYKAVAWIDFVQQTQPGTMSTKADAVVPAWALSDNSIVTDPVAGKTMNILSSAEERDAYTVIQDFNITANGDIDGAADNQVLELTAKRKFSKVTVVLTDYSTKEEWLRLFNNMGAKSFQSVAMGIEGLTSQYDARTSTLSKPADAITYLCSQFIGAAEEGVNEVKWFEENGGFYPVLEFNYVMPASFDDNATYNMTFKAFNVENPEANVNETVIGNNNLLAVRNASAVPVRTNAHTIIRMNMFKEYSCKVTIYDLFDGGKTDATLTDDNKLNPLVTTYYISAETGERIAEEAANLATDAKVVYSQNPWIDPVFGDTHAAKFDVSNVTKENFDHVMNDFAASNWDKEHSFLNLYDVKSLPAVADFQNMLFSGLHINLPALTEETTLQGIEEKLLLDNTAAQSFPLNINTNSEIRDIRGTESLDELHIINALDVVLSCPARELNVDKAKDFVLSADIAGNMTITEVQNFFDMFKDLGSHVGGNALFKKVHNNLVLNNLQVTGTMTVEEALNATIKAGMFGKDVTLANVKNQLTVEGGMYYGLFTANSPKVQIDGGAFYKKVSLNQAAIDGNIIFNGGKFGINFDQPNNEGVVEVYSNATLNEGVSLNDASDALLVKGMDEAKALVLTVNLNQGDFIGRLNAEVIAISGGNKLIHTAKFVDEAMRDTYTLGTGYLNNFLVIPEVVKVP